MSDIHISRRAIERFEVLHGVGGHSAELQLRNMVEDFAQRAVYELTQKGFVIVKHRAYVLTLSPDRGTVVNYATLHRERTWEQVKHGVASRVDKVRALPGDPAREPGPAVAPQDFATEFDAGTVALTARVRGSFGRHFARGVEGTALDEAIRAAAADLGAGALTLRDTGVFEVRHDGRVWLVSPDCRWLIGVGPPRPRTEVTR